VEAFVERPDAGAICEALRRGDVYASTGARIRSLMVTPQTYRVEPASEDATVVFIGEGGKVLSKRTGAAAYELTGDEGYVRARVEERAGSAWTPAVRVMRGRPGRS
jgi:hypothetical protein